jgi:UDP:flavonoid glycosyltransferase YjiC (YdhE family)
MRVLFVASPMVGHVQPLIPLATAFHGAGHQVLFATAAEGVAPVRSAGLDVRDVAPGFDVRKVFTRVALRHPVLAARESRGLAGTDLVGRLFAPVCDLMADDALALADEWRPDLVVHEPLAATGSFVAARHDLPAVTVDTSLFDPRELLRVTLAEMDRTVQRCGVEHVPPPAEMLVTAPASVARSTHGRPMRHVQLSGDRPAPDEFLSPGPRRRILVSRSTVEGPLPDLLMSRVAAAAAGTDLDVVLVRPDRRVTRRQLPPNVRTTEWLPFPAVFPAAAGVVHHGGAGTLLTALAAGIPQLVVPGAGDRRVNADLVAARGAGLAIPANRITATDLERLVTDPGLTAAAREVAAEMAAMPAPDEVVDDLVALVR